LGLTTNALEQQLYNERFLLKRALLQAIDHAGEIPPVLLIDEIDRADDEFEAYLLEVLSDYQITVPEIGRVHHAVRPPLVILTSNRTRDVHDALKRRCLYHWVEHPDFEREVQHRAHAGATGARPAGPAGGRRRRGAAHAQPVQAAGRCRDHRLGDRRWQRSGRTELDERSSRSPSARC
jgi:MoxR-like ATPase